MAEDGTNGRLLADGGSLRLSKSDADSDGEMMEWLLLKGMCI